LEECPSRTAQPSVRGTFLAGLPGMPIHTARCVPVVFPTPLYDAGAVEARLVRWAVSRGYQQPVVEVVGDGLPGTVEFKVCDDAGIEASVRFVLDGRELRCNDSSLSRAEAAAIDAEVER